MNNKKIKTVRGQAILIGIMFLISMALAVIVAIQRDWFESLNKEKFMPLTPDKYIILEKVKTGEIKGNKIAEISVEDRQSLYEYWMTYPEMMPSAFPKILIEADSKFYFSRVEQTIVCGQHEQKLRALKFLDSAGSKDALPMLEEVQKWAGRRNMPELMKAIEITIELLKQK